MDNENRTKSVENKNPKKKNRKKRKEPRNKAMVFKDVNQTKVDVMNTATRLPALIMIDTSHSMTGCEEIIKNSVMSVYNEINANGGAKNAVETGVITFSDIINVLVNIQEVYKQEDIESKLNITTSGMTLMGLALEKGLSIINERRQSYINSKGAIRCYAPVLFVISDGNSFCSDLTLQVAEENAMANATKTIKELVGKNELVVIFFEIGENTNHKNAVTITGCDDDKRVIHLMYTSEQERNKVISEVFHLTSSMMINLSGTSGNSRNIDNIIKEIKEKYRKYEKYGK